MDQNKNRERPASASPLPLSTGDRTERRRSFIINTIYIALVLTIFFLIFKYAMPMLLPFIIGFIIASIVQPIIRFLSEKLHFNNRFTSLILVTLLFGLIVFALYALGSSVFSEGKKLYDHLPSLTENLPAYLSSLQEKFYELLAKLHPDLSDAIQNTLYGMSNDALSKVGTLATNILTGATAFVGKLPQYFITLVVSIISGYLVSANYEVIVKFIERQIPENKKTMVDQIWEHLALTIFRMFKAYALLLTITFVELTIGFTIIGVDYAILLAMVVALIDILPILGVGTVLIPWSLYNFFIGDLRQGVSFIVLYLVILIVRQYLEPKVVGVQIGLPPIVMLICIFIGFKFAGLIGVFLFPMIMIILKKLNDNGYIHIWEPLHSEDYPKHISMKNAIQRHVKRKKK